MNIGILTYEAYDGRKKDSVGSSRIRGSWLIKHWPEAEAFKIGKKYDAILFQKAYFTRYMKEYKGIKILDLCDPDWMERKPVVEAIQEADAVTCSSIALADYVRKMTDKPVHYIPDRVDLDSFPLKKNHQGQAQGVVWYGYHGNFEMIDQCLMTIKRLGLRLTVISDSPYYPGTQIQGIDEAWIMANIRNIMYHQDQINNDIIQSGDIVLNPQATYGKWQFKSQNKTVIAWAMGMPVARDSEDLERFMDPNKRQSEAENNLEVVKKFWDTKQSVEQMKKVIETIKK